VKLSWLAGDEVSKVATACAGGRKCKEGILIQKQ
jgi:hypothetical protein